MVHIAMGWDCNTKRKFSLGKICREMHQRKNELNGCCGADGTHVELDTQVLTYATAAKKKMARPQGRTEIC